MKTQVDEFTLTEDDEVSASYIDLAPNRTKYEGIVKRVVVFKLSRPCQEVNLDLDENGRVLGLELL